MTYSRQTSSCRDNYGFSTSSVSDLQVDWLGNAVQTQNQSSVPKEVDWLGQPVGPKMFVSEPCMGQSGPPPASVPHVTIVRHEKPRRPPAPPFLSFGQKSCLAFTTGAAFTGTVTM